MHVGLLLFFDDYRGGAEWHSLQLAQRLRADGNPVSLIVKAEAEQSFLDFVNARGFSDLVPDVVFRSLSECDSFSGARKFYRDFPAEVYVCPKGGYGSGSWPLELLARLQGRRFVTIEHTTPPCLGSPNRRFLPRWGVWQTGYRLRRWSRSIGPARIVTVSRTAREAFVREFWYTSAKTVGVPNGIDANRFQPDEAARRQGRNAIGIGAGSPVMGVMCRLVGLKQVDVALRAMADLIEQRAAAPPHLLIYGDGPERNELGRLVEQLSLSRWVHWGGETHEPWNIYPMFDYFLLPSRQEGLPLSLLEAMASGCIPVASPVGGVPEVIRDGQNGFLAASSGLDEFTATLRTALDADAAARSRIARSARATVCEHFNLSTQMKRLSDEIILNR